MAYIVLIAIISGLLMYLLSSNAKAQELGRMIFVTSILALFIALAPLTVRWLS